MANKVIDTTKTTKVAKAVDGTAMHNTYDPIQYAVASGQKKINESLKDYGSKLRPDAVDFENHIIYELKPYSKRNYRKALRQAKRYADIIGNGRWTIVVDLYRM